MTNPGVGPMQLPEVIRTADLVRSVISPLEYYSEEARGAEISKYTTAGLEALVAEDPYSVLVARSGTDLVGFCVSRFDDGVIWLAWFGVRDDFRGTGIASDILRQLEVATRARGCAKIWCDTRTENLRSQRVLERMGYSKICTLTHHWYGHNFHLWEKRLELGS